MTDADILSDLTPQQLEAVTHRDGPMLVIAGAGSGKTRVVTRRIAWLINQGVWPQQLLAMTFTNKAAREMRERVEAMVGQAPQHIGTFHSCCAHFLRRDIERLDNGRNSNFTIYDASDQKGLMTRVLKDCGAMLPRTISASLILSVLSAMKNRRCTLDEACPDDESRLCAEEIGRVAAIYESALRRNNAVDFDDLLLMQLQLLGQCPDVLERYHARFRYLLVDEYQDTNRVQYQLIMKLANDERNLHVTGDPDQSIYSWRGADYNNIMSFNRDFPDARIVKLERNYRSTPTILNAANAVIANNRHRFPKSLFTENADGRQITDFQAASDRSEAEWIARKIERIRQNGHQWHDFAVFYRTNAQSRSIEEAMIKNRIPYQLLGGLRFYDRREIKDFICLLRLRVNPDDEAGLQRVFEDFPVCDGLGPKTLDAIRERAAARGRTAVAYLASEEFLQEMCGGKSKRALRLRGLHQWSAALAAIPLEQPAAEAIQAIDQACHFSEQIGRQYGTENLESRQENLSSFYERARRYARDFPEATLETYLQDVALVADVDNHDDAADSVVLMTLHSSKGLEFPFVFIAGVEEDILPHKRACECGQAGAVEEERRLFYVGLTRARQAVYLSHVRMRFTYNNVIFPQPSRFLDEIPGFLVKRLNSRT